jgi:hypothetical protein
MYLWFGDSWPIGSELGSPNDNFDSQTFPNVLIGRDNPTKAFPHLVSKYKNTPYINFAKGGSSIDYALYSLLNFCKNKIDKNVKYTAFLCLTAQTRGFGILYSQNKFIDYNYSDDRNDLKTDLDMCIYESVIALNCFYLLCNKFNIDCKFIPIFCDLIIPEHMEHIFIADEAVITVKSLVELTFGTPFLENNFSTISPDSDTLTGIGSLEWVRPNLSHPNMMGHRKLAYKIIELIENN